MMKQVVMVKSETVRLVREAKKEFPGCKIGGPCKFSDHTRFYVRDINDNILKIIKEY